MRPLPIFLVILASLAWGPSPVRAQPIDSSDATSVKLLSGLDLSANQERKIRAIVVGANKVSIRLRADMEIAGIDLRAELEEEAVSEERVGKLIEKISALEGELRKSSTISWVRIRKLLSAKQRSRFDALKQSDEVTRISRQAKTTRKRRALAPFRSRDSQSTVKDPFRARDAESTTAACDEVTCLVNPAKACCKNSTLLVATRPVATIYVDGQMVGMSPLQHKLHSGAHKIKAVFENGSTKVGTVQIKAGARHRLSWVAK